MTKLVGILVFALSSVAAAHSDGVWEVWPPNTEANFAPEAAIVLAHDPGPSSPAPNCPMWHEAVYDVVFDRWVCVLAPPSGNNGSGN